MKILVVNDDGIRAPGIRVLVQELLKISSDILVVAPATEQSAKSSSLTIYSDLTLHEVFDLGVPAYALGGTPVDCVKFAYYHLRYDFDILFSGVNNGLNIGTDLIYSGTVAAAKEAGLLHKKAIACSVRINQFEAFAQSFMKFWNHFSESECFKIGKVFNVNFPMDALGYKVTHQGISTFVPKFAEKTGVFRSVDSGIKETIYNDSDSDIKVFFSQYISVTPITTDQTDYSVFNKVFLKK